MGGLKRQLMHRKGTVYKLSEPRATSVFNAPLTPRLANFKQQASARHGVITSRGIMLT